MTARTVRAFVTAMSGTATAWSPVRTAAWLGATSLGAYGYLVATTRPAAATGDTLRDFLMARDCSDLGRCHTMGAATTVHGLYQGAAWLHVIAAVQAVGGGPHAVQRVVIAGFAAAVALLGWATARWLSPVAGFVAAVVYTAALALLGNAVVLWNHSPLALPATLAVCAGALLARTGRTRFALAAGAMTGLAVTLHLEGAVLLPALVVTAVLASRRPWTANAGLVAMALGAVALSSLEALKENVAWAMGRGLHLVALVVLLIASVIAALLRPRWERLGGAARLGIYGAFLIGTVSLGALWLLISEHHVFHVHYVDAVLPAVCVVPGAAIAYVVRRLPRWGQRAAYAVGVGLAGVGLALVASVTRVDQGRWTLDDHQRVARAVFQHGTSWDAVKLGIEGPRCDDTITGLALFAPAPTPDQQPGAQSTVLVVRLPPRVASGMRGTTGVIALEDGAAALIRPVESWLDRSAMQMCITPASQPRTCRPILPDPREYVGPDRFLFGRRSYPEAHSFMPSEPYTMEYEYAISSPPGAGPWSVELVDDGAAPCPWQITRVDGISFEGSVPGRSVVFNPGTARGTMVVGRRFDERTCGFAANRRLPPCLLESSPGDAVAVLVQRSR